jgi:hypothetical protein
MCEDIQPRSGEWLLGKAEFEEWKASHESSVLWLHGIPGSGKSELVAKVIQYLKDGVDVSANQMAYFYCLRDAAQDERSRPREAIYLLVLSRSIRYLRYSRDNTYRGSSELLYCYNSSLHSCLRTALL